MTREVRHLAFAHALGGDATGGGQNRDTSAQRGAPASTGLPAPIEGFFEANRRVSKLVEPIFPPARLDIGAVYERVVVEIVACHPNGVVVNVGAGKRCRLAEDPGLAAGVTIVASDISSHELARNRAVSARVVADASKALPFADATVDVLMSRSVLEHLPNVDAFMGEAARVLKPGGHSVHLFSGRWSPYTILNRLLPHRFARRLLFALRPSVAGTSGFKAFYDRCS